MTGAPARVWAITAHLVTQFRRDPRTLALLFIAPVLVMTLLGYVITEKETELDLGLVQNDQGVTTPFGGSVALGPVLEQVLEARGLSLTRLATEADLAACMTAGELKGGLVVPVDFTRDLLAGRGPGGLRLILEGSDAVLSGDLARRFALAVQDLPGMAAAEIPTGSGLAAPRQPEVTYVYGGPDLGALSYFAPGYVGFFAFFFTFLLTSVSFLRERASGTMEKLLSSPVRRAEIVLGYLLGFGVFALVQSLIILLFAVYALGVKLAGSLGAAFVVEGALVAVAVVMGIFFSFYARNELQVIQFIPIVIIPQIVLSGFMTPLETMYQPLRWLAMAMPMTYANEALRAVMIRGWGLDTVVSELAVLAGFVIFFTVLASRLLRRRIA